MSHSMDEPRNLGELFLKTAEKYPDKAAFFYKLNGRYASVTWAEALSKVRSVAAALLKRGLKPGERIAILSENRPEWAWIDLAAQSIGAASVPIYTSLTPHEIQYILHNSGAKVLAVSNAALFEKIPPIQNDLPELQLVIGFESGLSLSADELKIPFVCLKDLEKSDLSAVDFNRYLEAISADSIASIIYTSGTTDLPKGVMLTHSNFIHNVIYCKTALKMGETDIHLSFLPLSHVFERMAGHYLMIAIGATIAYAENMDTVPQNLLEIKPTFILGVPRFYEKIKDRVIETVEKASSVKKGLFYWAKALRKELRQGPLPGNPRGVRSGFQHRLADLLVYKKFRKKLGGRIRFCVSGGAPLSKDIAEFFFDLGVMIYEGYGLTETSPVIAVNREEKYKFGTVGVPLENIETKISEDGEILTKGVCVMKGYLNKPEETAAVLKDGWFCTGDLGSIDREGFLTITGRKKELIVTSGGKKVVPRAVEEVVEKDPAIVRCVLFGEGKKFITALIVPNKDKVADYANEQKIAFQNYGALLQNPRITQWIEGIVDEHSKDLASFEKIKYFLLLENDFTQAAGELTPTLKIKRDIILSRHKDKLLALYEKVS